VTIRKKYGSLLRPEVKKEDELEKKGYKKKKE